MCRFFPPLNRPSDPEGSARSADGFTLVEMLVVLTIIVILTVLAGPAVNTILKGSQLTQGAQLLGAELSLAKQTALTKNCTVEVRLYQWADPSVAGETAGNVTTGKYRAMQMFQLKRATTTATTTYVALDKVQQLPVSVFIDSGLTLSNLINKASTLPSVPTLATGTTLNLPLPGPGLSYNSVSFHFFPSGATDLPTGTKWFLTLHNINDGDTLGSPPKNFYTIQIASLNGHLRNFRP